ncbi:hypothetical protein [Ectobacillus ponti]|uniref:Uncharacterized protein n=1 Tax=Ectobacillus ponti TaxID=2961894 RepID=A0AA41X6S5_9BACI|nr:hypothetical protein [Ectobacillus ponti]MCP8969981.1 hypothetical protein [Ectobacillus ponti]
MYYEVYVVGNDRETIGAFESEWRFKERENLFIRQYGLKRSFIIQHITHDILENGRHVVRLYCQEKRMYY